MCIKIGNDELDSVKGLMIMCLNSIISDVFDIDFEDLDVNMSLTKNLKMTDAQAADVIEQIDEYFDGLSINLKENDTLEQLFNTVVAADFEDI